MYANLRKEVLDDEKKVIFRKTFSIDMETSPEPEKLIEYFKNQGYVNDGDTVERMYK